MTAALIVAADPAAAVSCSGLRGDVNGDGYAEVAVGEPGDLVRRGGVHVLYGTVAGLDADGPGSALNDQWFAKGSGGVPGRATHHDDFGLAVGFGDFNGDGCADLAIGAPGDRAANDPPDMVPPPGDVTVLYGSRLGITTAGAQAFRLVSMFPDQIRRSERFGAALIAGDLNGDGIDDLAMGAPYANLSSSESDLDRDGAVAVVFGSPDGLDRGEVRAALLTGSSAGGPDPGTDTVFGTSLAIGNFDGDRGGVHELAVGDPERSPEGGAWDGAIVVFSGGASGFGTVTATVITQNTAGVPGSSEVGDGFGAALAAGDVTGDGRTDLAVGVPGEDDRQGAVVLLKGSANGLTGSGAQRWSQASTGVSGTPGIDDQFGLSLVAAPLDADRYADLAIGAPADWLGAVQTVGSVTLLRGSSGGLTTSGFGGLRLTAGTAGIAGDLRTGSGFGVAVTTAQVQGGGPENLIIGSPSALSGGRFGGLINQLGRADSGPRPTTSRAFGQHTADLRGTADDGDAFGWAVG